LEIISFLKENHYLSESSEIIIENPGFGCSSFSVKNKEEDGYYFARNYDWGNTDAAYNFLS